MPASRTLARGTALLLTGVFAACADVSPAGPDLSELEPANQVESCQPDASMDESLLNGSQDDLLDGPKGKKGGWGGTLFNGLYGGSTTESTSGTSGSTSTSTTGYLTNGNSTKVDAGGVGSGQAGAEGVCTR